MEKLCRFNSKLVAGVGTGSIGCDSSSREGTESEASPIQFIDDSYDADENSL